MSEVAEARFTGGSASLKRSKIAANIMRHMPGKYGIIQAYAFVALLARVKPRISTVRAAMRWCVHMGAFSVVISYRAFACLTRNPIVNRALSFLHRHRNRGQ